MEKLIQQLNKRVAQKSAFEILSFFIRKYEGTLAFGTSLGAEDQVITDMIARIDKGTKIFTLDTGRVFPETYDTLQQTNEKYGINIEVYFPNSEKVERMVNEKGINLFYESVENRRTCCQVRKIEPLQRAMTGIDAWITGIRKEQSITRTLTQIVELDAGSRRLKINPLVNWSEKDVWDYIRENGVPYNKLHDRGFPSIGCQPCTRAVETGEDVRAGRWWWETPEQKECGLHKRNGQLNQKV